MPKPTFTKPGPSKPALEEEVSLVVSYFHLFVQALISPDILDLHTVKRIRDRLGRGRRTPQTDLQTSFRFKVRSLPPSSSLSKPFRPDQLTLIPSYRRNRDTIAEREKELDPDIVEAKRAAEIEKQKEDSKNLVADSIVRELAESETSHSSLITT